MNVFHKELSGGRWSEMPFCVQMANVGSEVSRALRWREKGREDFSKRATERALELLDMTIMSAKKYSRIRELSRTREILVDFFYCDNEYSSTGSSLVKFFDRFNYLARKGG